MRHCWKLTWKQRPRWCKRPHAWQTQQGTRTFLMMTLSRPLHHLHGKQVIIFFKILVSFVLQTSFFQCHCFEVISPPLTLGAFSSSHFLQAVDSPLPTCWMSNWPSWLCPKKRVNGCHLIFSFSTLFLLLLLLLRLVLMVVVRHFVGDRGVKFLLGGSPQSGGGGPRAHHLIDQGGEQCKCHQRATTNHKLPATHVLLILRMTESDQCSPPPVVCLYNPQASLSSQFSIWQNGFGARQWHWGGF